MVTMNLTCPKCGVRGFKPTVTNDWRNPQIVCRMCKHRFRHTYEEWLIKTREP